MNVKMKTLQLKENNTDYPVTLIYDKCRSGESQYGSWNLYGVEYGGEQRGIFAEGVLHQKLKKYRKDTKLVIRRKQIDECTLEWQVVPANDKGSNNSNRYNQTVLNHLDDRTRDIHRQVALKIATISIGQTTKPWADEDIQEIKIRMDKLLVVLDGESEDELPF